MRYWLDTEFIERGPDFPIILLSIGIVAEDGREFYAEASGARAMIEIDYDSFGDPWLRDNVLPHLHGNGLNRDEITTGVHLFCAPEQHGKPEFWAYYADYDWVVFCQIFGRMIDLPKGFPMYCRDLKQFCDDNGGIELPRQETPEHHALHDARWTKQAWEFAKGTVAEWHE